MRACRNSELQPDHDRWTAPGESKAVNEEKGRISLLLATQPVDQTQGKDVQTSTSSPEMKHCPP